VYQKRKEKSIIFCFLLRKIHDFLVNVKRYPESEKERESEGVEGRAEGGERGGGTHLSIYN